MVSRWLAIMGGVLILALLAGGLTEVALAFGRMNSTADDVLVRPMDQRSVAPTPTPTPTPTPAPPSTPTPTLTLTPTPTPAGPTAVTNGFVRLRASNTTASAVLAELNGGTRVQLLPVSDSQWQKVQYGNLVGYIFKAYLRY
jgi:hypothetical protein